MAVAATEHCRSDRSVPLDGFARAAERQITVSEMLSLDEIRHQVLVYFPIAQNERARFPKLPVACLVSHGLGE